MTPICSTLNFHSRSLGFSGAVDALQSAAFGQSSLSPIMMDDIDCDGDEHSLAECSHRGWESHNCAHSEDASVRCSYQSGKSCP